MKCMAVFVLSIAAAVIVAPSVCAQETEASPPKKQLSLEETRALSEEIKALKKKIEDQEKEIRTLQAEYQQADGVAAATRLGQYNATLSLSSGSRVSATVLGIDRIDFPATAFWRNDFAEKSLGAMMNDLAINQDGVFVNSQFLEEYNLEEGENLRVTVSAYGQSSQLNLQIVGRFDLFPTWYPSDGPLIVGNLDFFNQPRSKGRFLF